MAKQTVSKSELIRAVLAKHPRMSPREVADAINAENGVKVTRNLVYMIKLKDARKSGRRERPQVVSVNRVPNAVDPATVITAVRELANQVGGVGNLRRILDALE